MQPDMLKSMRLDVPVLPKLLQSLQKNGIPVSMAYTYEDAEKSLLQAFKGKTMIEELFFIEKQAYQDSFIHRLDARVKIILAFAAIIAIVAVPYSTMIYTVGAIFFCFFVSSGLLPGSPRSSTCKRLLAIVPLWGIIILFQIFFKNKYYTDYHVLYHPAARYQHLCRIGRVCLHPRS